MEIATFRKWLAEHGCRFGAESENREEGNGTVTVHRLGRTAELPLVGANHELDPRYVRRVLRSARPGLVQASVTNRPRLRPAGRITERRPDPRNGPLGRRVRSLP